MTREELKAHCERQIEMCEMWAKAKGEKPSGKVYEEHKLILELLEQESCDDAIRRQAAIETIFEQGSAEKLEIDFAKLLLLQRAIKTLPPVTPQPNMQKCESCRWWKDSDGVYRRGVGAESICPINRAEVLKGEGYCFLYEPKMEAGE